MTIEEAGVFFIIFEIISVMPMRISVHQGCAIRKVQSGNSRMYYDGRYASGIVSSVKSHEQRKANYYPQKCSRMAYPAFSFERRCATCGSARVSVSLCLPVCLIVCPRLFICVCVHVLSKSCSRGSELRTSAGVRQLWALDGISGVQLQPLGGHDQPEQGMCPDTNS